MPVEMKPVLKFAKLSEHALPPSKGSVKSAGYDLKRYDVEITIVFLVIYMYCNF